MNMYENSFLQGYNILGGTYGYNCNTPPFINCNGEMNYDALLGYSIFNVFAGVASKAIQHHKENKPAEIDYNKKISETNTEIKSKQNEIYNLETEKTSDLTTIGDAKKSIDDLNNNIKNLNAKIQAFETIKNADPKPENYEELKLAAEEAFAEKKRIEKEAIPAKEKIIADANAKIKENDQQIDKLELEIQELKAQALNYERARAKNGGEDCLKTGFYDKEKNPASKKALKTALNKFKKAKNFGDKAETRKFATIVKEMYTSNPTELNKYKVLCDKAIEWLDSNSTQQ